MKYTPVKIEKKWQKEWQSKKLYTAKDSEKGKQNRMLLVEFPYPSGNLHMGHWYAFALPDMQARYLRMRGYNVMYPIGFDAFGLPAENAAIKRSIHPRDWTKKNIAYMSNQLQSMGAMFDWSRVVSTIDPDYYRWTQWIFLKMYEKGLAYRSKTKANWCPKDKTVLANEQVVNGVCERCDTPVVQKEIEQWMFKITAYADRLIDDIEGLDWPQTTVLAQRNWIGRSEGAKITFSLTGIPGQKDGKHFVEVFTTRADTLFGVTAVVISPELAQKWIDVGWQASVEVKAYIKKALSKRELDRMEQTADKTGVPAGIDAINPANDEKVPVWVADYVLGNYGTGAVMMVPAHDERDFAFAKKFNIPVKNVVDPVIVRDDAKKISAAEFKEKKKIVAFVESEDGKNVLTIHWKPELGGRLLVGGTVEEGESPETTALREVREETGYSDLELVSVAPETLHYKYYAFSKQQAFSVQARFVHIRLKSDVRRLQALEKTEQGNFSVEWISKKELTSQIKEPLHAYTVGIFTNPKAYTDDGILSNSSQFTRLSSSEARKKIVQYLKQKGTADFQKTYRLRDWVLSRQRYWGVPIPMIKCEACGFVPALEKDLPVKLPPLKDFLPTDDGRSPLAKAKSWLKVKCPKCKGAAERETDTMDTFVDSSWYFIRYTDPKNKKKLADEKKMKAWLPVPMYIGGAEHNTMHLLYSRFFTKVLHDLGYIHFNEPFIGRRNHGIILGPDGQKMSKSRGNVVDPDKEVAQYGSDTVRMYLAFMAPYEQGGPWDPKGINGVYRFLNRTWNLVNQTPDKKLTIADAKKIAPILHRAIKAIGDDLAGLRFNTGVSGLMKALNALEDVVGEGRLSADDAGTFLKILAPFAPHITEELWRGVLKKKKSIHVEPWPLYEESYLADEEIDMPVQVNGKVRAVLKVSAYLSEEKLKEMALASEAVQKHINGQSIKKIIVIPKRLISIVV